MILDLPGRCTLVLPSSFGAGMPGSVGNLPWDLGAVSLLLPHCTDRSALVRPLCPRIALTNLLFFFPLSPPIGRIAKRCNPC